MSETVKFRCPKCLKLLFTFNKLTGNPEYRVSQYAFYDDAKGAKYITCVKCKTELEITKKGLIESGVVCGN